MIKGTRMMMKRGGTPPLPYDAEVKYLESTGTQYIDTGVYGNDNLIASVSCMATAESGSVRDVFGAIDTTHDVFGYYFRVRIPSNSMVQYTAGLNTRAAYKITVTSIGDWHALTLDTTTGSKKIFVDGAQSGSTVNDSAYPMATKLYLFAQNNKNGTANDFSANVRVSAFSIKDAMTNKFILDIVPVRFTNELGQSEGAMYDRVSGQLFRNAGTGAFVVGPDK